MWEAKELLWAEHLYPHQNSYTEIVVLKGIALGAGIFGEWLGYEGRAFMTGISDHIKSLQRDACPCSYARLKLSIKMAI